jgi:hypothetical protein
MIMFMISAHFMRGLLSSRMGFTFAQVTPTSLFYLLYLLFFMRGLLSIRMGFTFAQVTPTSLLCLLLYQ